jgi:hypothetical protein
MLMLSQEGRSLHFASLRSDDDERKLRLGRDDNEWKLRFCWDDDERRLRFGRDDGGD